MISETLTILMIKSCLGGKFCQMTFPPPWQRRNSCVIGLYDVKHRINFHNLQEPHSLNKTHKFTSRHTFHPELLQLHHQTWQLHFSPCYTFSKPHSAAIPSISPQSPSKTSKNTKKAPRKPQNTQILSNNNFTKRVPHKLAVL
jgi:hypothetical protein